MKHSRSALRSIRRKLRRAVRGRMELLEPRRVLAGETLILSEILAANSGGLNDADGESSDWIEIHNPNATPVDLQGWGLTDNPGDLNAWTFPDMVIGPNEFLTVFASGKDRAVAGEELHTNFRLSGTGEYLGLIRPDGTTSSEFAPSFPLQVTNISYGPTFFTQQLIDAGASARVLVPSSNSLGANWTSRTFNDSSWTAGPTGIGFGVVQSGFDVTYIAANVPLNDLATARSVIENTSLRRTTVDAVASTINYNANGGSGNFSSDIAFPTQNIGDDYDDFLVLATATLDIPAAGNWSFGVNSDDGFGLTLERNGVTFTSEYAGLRGASDTIATFNLPEAGAWKATVVIFEHGGGASGEFFAAAGAKSSIGDGGFTLVGDRTAGGLSAYFSTGEVGTNIRGAMDGVNASAYVRVPFTVSDPAAFDALQLKMRYDDGFVAYLNGVEVVRRNAPTALAYNSVASADRDPLEVLAAESINLTGALSQLRTGNNVLAIHGLNFSASDNGFLVLPELVGSALLTSQARYYEEPTPGEPNSSPSLGVAERPVIDQPAGFYDASFTVTITAPTAGSQIRYTTDGSTPSATNGSLYSAPITVSGTTTLRAAAVRANYISLPSVTRTYLFLDDVIRQSANGSPPAGWPSSWGSNVVDYGMDPDVVDTMETPQKVKDALKAVPSLAISTDLANLFDSSTGIYANAYNDDRAWERPASLELLNPDGSDGFQVNAGLRIRGGYSRSSGNPKHSFRLFFRGEYGDSSLDYPMFEDEGVKSFKKLDLRTAQNYSWSFGGDPNNTFIEDVFTRETQRDLGQPYTRSRWYHLYIDGQYWGLYQSQERADAEYAASYFGGSDADYDVIKPEAGSYSIVATDGNFDAFRELWQQALAGFSTDAAYLRAQGKNPDGSDNPNYPVLLDVDNLVTYMLGILYGGNLDAPISAFLGNSRVNNFFAVRDRTSREGFRYFLHDSEHTLHNVNENRNGPYSAGSDFNYFNPQWLHQQLMSNAEYRLHFADAVQDAFFNGGPLSVTAAQARWQNHIDQLDQAIIAESARWGDAQRPNDPLGRTDWLAAAQNTHDNFLANRGAVVVQQFRDIGLFPNVGAPGMLINGAAQHGGAITAGSTLRFSGAATTYYTTDGSDPRLAGGGISPNASSYDATAVQSTLLAAGSVWKYFDGGTDLGTAWKDDAFNDATWASGTAEFGYGDGGEATVIGYGPDAGNRYITTYFRRTFQATDPSSYASLTLRLKRDDGAIVYINGVEAARSNMPAGTVSASTLASGNVGGADEATFFDVPLNASLLRAGANLIAVEIHQAAANSNDFSFDAELIASGTLQPGRTLDASTRIVARTRDGSGVWSAANDATFLITVPAAPGNLAITEIMYHPPDPSGSEPAVDKEHYEFIELKNIGTQAVSLAGVQVSAGIAYDFADSDIAFLAPGEIGVLVHSRSAFIGRYGTTATILGSFEFSASNNLSNGGERITLADADGLTIVSFAYDDVAPWPLEPDGGGYSLTLKRADLDPDDAANWRASSSPLGTPGFEEDDLQVTGTPGDDLFQFTYSAANAVAVQLNGVPLGTMTSSRFQVDGLGGNDSVTVVGMATNDAFTLLGNRITLNGVGFDFSNVESYAMRGAGGNDALAVQTGASNDTVVYSATGIIVNGTNFGLSELESISIDLGLGDDSLRLDAASGLISAIGGGGSNTLQARQNVHFTLSDTNLSTTAGGIVRSMTISGFGIANLTGGSANNTFDVSGWTGKGTLSSGGGTDVVKKHAAVSKFTLKGIDTNTLVTSDGMTMTLSNVYNADLKDTGANTNSEFDVSSWYRAATLDGGAGTDKLYINRNFSTATLSDTKFASGTNKAMTLANLEVAELIGGTSNNTATVGGWTGAVSFDGGSNTGGGVDAIAVSRDVDFTINDSQLVHGLETVSLSNVESFSLTGGDGANDFNVSNWNGVGSIFGKGGTDKVISSKTSATFNKVDFTLSNTALTVSMRVGTTTLSKTVKLAGVELADLTGGHIANTFNLASGWTGGGTINAGGGNDAVNVSRDSSFTVNGTNVLVGGVTTNLNDVESLSLTGGAGANSFTVNAGWTNALSINGAAGVDKINVASRDVNYSFTNVAGSTTKKILNVGSRQVSLDGIESANLIGGASANTFNFTNWNGADWTGSASGLGGDDMVIVARDGNMKLEAAKLTIGTASNFGLTSIERTELSGAATNSVGNTYTISGWTGELAVDGKAGTDVIVSSGNTNFTLTNTSATAGTLKLGNVASTWTLANVENANLTGGTGDNTFTLTGWTGGGKLVAGTGTDALVVTAGLDMTLSNASSDPSLKIGSKTLGASGFERATLTVAGATGRFVNAREFSGAATLNGGVGNDVLWGGSGADTLIGNGGDDVLVGNGGADVLNGNAGRDLLIGGGTALIDTLHGGDGDDIVIGGTTSWDANKAALDALMTAWSSPTSAYADRVTRLRDTGVGTSNSIKLNKTNVPNDGAVDQLLGGNNQDWFLADNPGAETLSDKAANETVTDL